MVDIFCKVAVHARISCPGTTQWALLLTPHADDYESATLYSGGLYLRWADSFGATTTNPVPSLLVYSDSFFSQWLLFIGYQQRYSRQPADCAVPRQRYKGSANTQISCQCVLRKTEADFSIQGPDPLTVEISQYPSCLFFLQLLFNTR